MFRCDIENSLHMLHRGGLILYPTDTVWGIGCDATSNAAVERIFAVKQRNETRSMLTLVNGMEMLAAYVEKIPDTAIQLLQKATAPLSIIYPKARNLAANLVASDGSIGVRIVQDVFCSQLISEFGRPIVSTSANISGQPAPAIFSDISVEIRQAVDYTVRWRQNDLHTAAVSSIIKLNTDGTYCVLR